MLTKGYGRFLWEMFPRAMTLGINAMMKMTIAPADCVIPHRPATAVVRARRPRRRRHALVGGGRALPAARRLRPGARRGRSANARTHLPAGGRSGAAAVGDAVDVPRRRANVRVRETHDRPQDVRRVATPLARDPISSDYDEKTGEDVARAVRVVRRIRPTRAALDRVEGPGRATATPGRPVELLGSAALPGVRGVHRRPTGLDSGRRGRGAAPARRALRPRPPINPLMFDH